MTVNEAYAEKVRGALEVQAAALARRLKLPLTVGVQRSGEDVTLTVTGTNAAGVRAMAAHLRGLAYRLRLPADVTPDEAAGQLTLTTTATVTATTEAGGPTVLFADDFETGDLSMWDDFGDFGGTVEVVGSAAYAGNYGLRMALGLDGVLNVTKDLVAFALLPASRILSVRARFRCVARAGTNACDAITLGAGARWALQSVSGSTWRLSLAPRDGGPLRNSSTFTLSVGAGVPWRLIELVYDATVAPQILKCFADGVLVASVTDPSVGADPQGATVALYANENYTTTANSTITYHIDDVTVTDAYQGA